MTKKSEITQELEHLGLSAPEALVYEQLLPRGARSVQEITDDCALPRSTVNLALDVLVDQGIVHFFYKGKRKQYYVRSPEDLSMLVNYAQEQTRHLEYAIDLLIPRISQQHFFAHDEDLRVAHYDGRDGFKEVFMMPLEMEGKELLRMSSTPEIFTVERDFISQEYLPEKMRRKIQTKILVPYSSQSNEMIYYDDEKMRETRVLDINLYDPKGQIAIWDDRVSFTAWNENLSSFVITSKALSDMMRQIFYLVWNSAKKIV